MRAACSSGVGKNAEAIRALSDPDFPDGSERSFSSATERYSRLRSIGAQRAASVACQGIGYKAPSHSRIQAPLWDSPERARARRTDTAGAGDQARKAVLPGVQGGNRT